MHYSSEEFKLFNQKLNYKKNFKEFVMTSGNKRVVQDCSVATNP